MDHDQNSQRNTKSEEIKNRDGIRVGNITNSIGVAIGTGASVTVQYYPIKLRAPLRRVFDPLIEDRMRLFGGRKDVFERIADFIKNPVGGYLVLTAPAGFGKTSLVAAMVAGASEAFAYHFFDPQYFPESLTQEFFLRNVVEQMAQWHDQKEILPDRVPELTALYQKFVGEPLDHTQILVLDGLDEVTGWPLLRYLSRRLPQNLHILLTIREVGQNWATEYGLPRDQLRHLPLGGLTREDVADALRGGGPIAGSFADNAALLDQVIRVSSYQADLGSGADPLYVRFVVEDIEEGKLTVNNLGQQPAGLEYYLDNWIAEITSSTKEAQAAQDLILTLVVALGPISRAELEEVNPSLRTTGLAMFPDAVDRVRRFVVGNDETGYTLMHPRLQHYMRTSRNVDANSQLERLLAYCADWPNHHSPYSLVYYARHLAQAGRKELLYRLIDKPWMDLKFQQRGSHRAFAQDVELAIECAQTEEPENFAEEVRDRLIFATLGSFATDVPLEIFHVLVATGAASRALDLAESLQDKNRRRMASLLIGQALIRRQQLTEAKTVLLQVLAITEAKDLSTLAAPLAQLGELEQVLKAIREIGDEKTRDEALVGIIQSLVKAGRLEEGMRILELIQDKPQRVRSQSYLVMGFAEIAAITQAVALGDDAEAQIASINNKETRARALGYLLEVFLRTGRNDRADELARQFFEIIVELNMDRSMLDRFAAVALAMAQAGKSVKVLAAIENTVEVRSSKNTEAGLLRILPYRNKRPGIRERVRATTFEAIIIPLAQAQGFPGGSEAAALLLDAIEQAPGEEKYIRAFALSWIPLILAQAGDHARVVELADRFFKEVDQTEFNDHGVSLFLQGLGPALVLVGRLDQALSIAATIHDGIARKEAQHGIAETLIRESDLSGALRLYDLIEDLDYTKTDVLVEATYLVTNIDDLERVKLLAQNISNKFQKMNALSAVAEGWIRLGSSNKALEFANQVIGIGQIASEGIWEKIRCFVRIAETFAELGDAAKASAVGHQTLAVIQAQEEKPFFIADDILKLIRIGIIEPATTILEEALKAWTDKDETLADLADALIQAGEFDRAMAAAINLKPYLKANILSKGALALANEAQRDKALSLTRTSLSGLENSEDERFDSYKPRTRSWTLSILAQALAQLGDKDKAKELADRSLNATEAASVGASERRAGMCQAAAAFAKLGDRAKALQILEQVITLANEGSSTIDEGHVLESVSLIFIQIGEFQHAHSIAQQMAGLGRSDENSTARLGDLDEYWKVNALDRLAQAFASAGEKERAVDLISMALTVTDRLSENSRAIQLVQVLSSLATLGRQGQALSIWKSELARAQLIGRARVFTALAAGSAMIGQTNHGLDLWAVYQAVQETETWWDVPKENTPIIKEG